MLHALFIDRCHYCHIRHAAAFHYFAFFGFLRFRYEALPPAYAADDTPQRPGHIGFAATLTPDYALLAAEIAAMLIRRSTITALLAGRCRHAAPLIFR